MRAACLKAPSAALPLPFRRTPRLRGALTAAPPGGRLQPSPHRRSHIPAAGLFTRAMAAGPSPYEGIDTQELSELAMCWAAQRGLLVGAGSALAAWTGPAMAAGVHAPVSLLPAPFPRAAYEQALRLAPGFNLLVDRVSRDGSYLRAALTPVLPHDNFTARLLDVHEAAAAARAALGDRARAEIALGIHRSDYMLDAPTGRLLQVELNTIASSFAALSGLTAGLHRAMIDRVGLHARYLPAHLPPNAPLEGLVDGLAEAFKAYGAAADEAVVLMIVQPGERNVFDQQWVAGALWDRHRLRCRRATLAQVASQGTLGGSDGQSLLLGGQQVAVIYYRAGYTPTDYPTQAEWDARQLLEKSAAAKCPSAAYHLTGAKKIQQDLARPGVLERFVREPAVTAELRTCFAGLWSLDAADSGAAELERVIHAALADPDAYVLKPQREGGGNNLYREALAARLTEAGPGLGAYVLMQRIRPPVQPSLMMREGSVREMDALSELGVFSVYLRRGDVVLMDRTVGHLLRTKANTSDEGGVAAGFAVLDSPYLT